MVDESGRARRVAAAVWRSASCCAAGECAEVCRRDGMVLLRDSADPAVSLAFSDEEWQAFTLAVRIGDFDRPDQGSP
jgi:hypothetical protein